uniref:Dipeptidase n=1 Tax=Callorhinchus milii TaxID=7868 RepID=V9KSJ1_CALMI|eukprot:gi/632944770/ref/XP_007887684.1/ PREDICTED: dipeptidase 2 [Callorhinchus milii]
MISWTRFHLKLTFKWRKAFLGSFLLLVLSTKLVSSTDEGRKALQIMEQAPLIDGHNDLPLQLRRLYKGVNKANLYNMTGTCTNIEKLKKGKVGAQFWSVYVMCVSQNKDAVRLTLEQIDIIKRMCKAYPDFEFVTSSDGIKTTQKIACLIGIEGGFSIDSSLAALRMFYELGVRYMSLTHNCNTPWAKSAVREPNNEYPLITNLTDFGKEIVQEMNRLGMMIDLSHASLETAETVLSISKAPVIFSHSSASAICNHPRNVPDKVLKIIKEKNGIIMVNFASMLVTKADVPANVINVADHFDHIKKTIGYESIGIGADFDGARRYPKGLEDVSKYPALIEELLRRKWTEKEIKAVLRNNFLRVFQKVEEVRDTLQDVQPSEVEIAFENVNHDCHLDLKKIARTMSNVLNSQSRITAPNLTILCTVIIIPYLYILTG